MSRSDATPQQVTFTLLPLLGLVPCCVPVVPGTPLARGPMEGRSELCAVEAAWMTGAAPTCDIHLQYVCAELGIDYDDLLAEAGRDPEAAAVPWEERDRLPQSQALDARSMLLGDAPHYEPEMT